MTVWASNLKIARKGSFSYYKSQRLKLQILSENWPKMTIFAS